MISRKLLMPTVLGLAAGVPYVTSEWDSLKTKFSNGSSPSAVSAFSATTPTTPALAAPTSGASSSGGALALGAAASSVSEPPIVDMNEAFQKTVTPAWITSRWPRVTTSLGVDNLHAYRVSLITGTRPDDVAGSLTYYFNASQQLERIVFRGSTGDSRRLVSVLTQKFDMNAVPQPDPRMVVYQTSWNGTAYNQLIIRPARVVRADMPMGRYGIELTLSQLSAKSLFGGVF